MLQLHLSWRFNREWTLETIAQELEMVGILMMASKGDMGLDGRLHNRGL